MNRVINGLMVCTLLGCAAARAEFSDQIKQIPFEVETLLKCGTWKEDKMEGFNRFLLVFVDGHSEIYIQWISVGVDYSSAEDDRLVSSISVREFTGHAAYTLSGLACKIDVHGKGSVAFDARNADEENGVYTAKLTEAGIGRYKMQTKRKRSR